MRVALTHWRHHIEAFIRLASGSSKETHMRSAFQSDTPTATEPWARRGTADDMLVMARVFACLEPDGRASLLAASHAAVARERAIADEAAPEPADLVEPLFGAIALLQAYADLRLDGKTQLLSEAIELVAQHRMKAATVPPGAWGDAHEWLTALADQTYPHGSDADGVLSLIRSVDADWESAVFTDGHLDVVAKPSEKEIDAGYGILAGYRHIKGQASPFHGIPDTAEAPGLDLAQDEFREFDGDGWVPNQVAYEAAIEHELALRFAELVVEWRERFFEALVDGTQPSAPEHADEDQSHADDCADSKP